jgi:DNA-binding PadR family transcriptional regulator
MTVQTLALLAAMLDCPDGEWYGLELTKACDLKSGTLYPILARLEHAGWLTSTWEDVDPKLVGRPRRRLYRLTGAGADTARGVVDEQLARLSPGQPSIQWGLRPRGQHA